MSTPVYLAVSISEAKILLPPACFFQLNGTPFIHANNLGPGWK